MQNLRISDSELSIEPKESAAISKLFKEQQRLNKRVEELEHELEQLKASRSWKITEPLRQIKPIINYCRSLFSLGPHKLHAEVLYNLVAKGDKLQVTGGNPFLILRSSKGFLPIGWCEILLPERKETEWNDYRLYIDSGEGFSEKESVPLSFTGGIPCLVNLPKLVRGLRLDPIGAQSEFSFSSVIVKEQWVVQILLRYLTNAYLNCDSPLELSKQLAKCLRFGGWRTFKQRLLGFDNPSEERNYSYRKWVKKYDTIHPTKIKELRAECSRLKYTPLISVLLPTYNTPERWLRKAIESVLKQAYENWELCIADDASSRSHVGEILNEYALKDDRIKVSIRPSNGHISRSSNTALDLASGEFVALMDHDDEITPDALYQAVLELNKNRNLDLLYSDEDRTTNYGGRFDPYFKGDFSLDLLLGQNCISHLGFYRTSIAKEIGGFRPGFEGSQDWDFALRFVEKTSPNRIKHIPKILYHWRLVPGTVSFESETKIDAVKAGQQAVQEYLDRNNLQAKLLRSIGSQATRIIFPLPAESKPISLCVLAKNQDSLSNWSQAVLKNSAFKNIEVIGAVETPSELRVSNLTENLRVLFYQNSGQADVLNQLGELSHGEYLCFLSDNLVPSSNEWLEYLIRALARDDVVAVGAKVWSSQGRVAHAGCFVNHGQVIDAHAGLKSGHPGYFNRDNLTQELLAVRAKCMAVKKEFFLKLGGFESAFTSGLFDVDFCLRARQFNRRILYCPYAELREATKVKSVIHASDRKLLMDKWSNLANDPFYNPNLSPMSGDFALSFPPTIA